MGKSQGSSRKEVNDLHANETAARPERKLTSVRSPISPTPVRRYSDQVHAGQLLWSFAVALCLVLAALLQWTSPKNALLEQDRAPAQIRLDLSNHGS